MHARVRELIDYAALCGFTLDGTDGHGHYRLVHENGGVVRVASTPGDYRGDDNCKALMRRVSGVTPPKPKAGRPKKGVEHRSRFSFAAARRERIPNASGRYTVGGKHPAEAEPLGLIRLRAEQTRLEKEIADFPSERLNMQLRDVTTRIAIGLY